VVLYSLLKRVYGNQISSLARIIVTKINKLAFIQAYKAAYYKVFTKVNIYLAFRSAGLVPFNLEVVLLKLNIKLRTPTPPTLETTL
jgi:hypothetical protein